MWPWGHLAVGYLCYTALVRLRGEGRQTSLALLAVGLGSQFPDLVDKPLAWSFAVLPSGRSLAHSLITASVIIGVAYWVGRRRGREEAAVAFGVGYVSHCLADLGPNVIFGLLRGDVEQLRWTTYLVWPLLPSPPYPNDSSFIEHLAAFEFSSYILVQFAFVGVAFLVWLLSRYFSPSGGHRRA
ncbi:LexA-binding, inner membrane-associated putative hydrolase [Halopelagius inordinatus]|uniref:LexA-binding, inner membrane-associated putative hydrolase n=1 Tax=Halopelagius inordinatus TaxID=553467 RepID=A0A1I2U5W8_9EURY|nr:metal-dependent hydrolase [Halopelagius inordinatus]SFG72478.1 LexA-binding, inner membrane-associated putative hydrolase [Halopelagius inordinatus]